MRFGYFCYFETLCFTMFLQFGKTNGFEYPIIYKVSVNYDGFDVVREFSALLSILVFLSLKLMKTLCF